MLITQSLFQTIRGVSVAQRSNRYGGILAPAEADARRYLEQGACFVAVGSDQALLQAATQTLRDRFREP